MFFKKSRIWSKDHKKQELFPCCYCLQAKKSLCMNSSVENLVVLFRCWHSNLTVFPQPQQMKSHKLYQGDQIPQMSDSQGWAHLLWRSNDPLPELKEP